MKNEYKITKKLMLSWAREYDLHGAANVVAFVCWLVVGVCGLLSLILFCWQGGDWLDIYISVLFLLTATFKLAFSHYFGCLNRYKLLSRTYGVAEWTRTTEFLEDEIVLTDHNSVAKFRYENIKAVKEKKNVVKIYFNGNLLLRLYKDAFVEGSWEECNALLAAKR